MLRYAVIVRILAGVMLMVSWGAVESPLSGVVFILLMVALSAARYRISPYRWLGIAEIAVCAIYATFWLPALLGLWLPVIGLLEDKWTEWEDELLQMSFEDRGERLKLESRLEASVLETQNAARLAELTERSRIAQDIHDHVGHEIAGASIAMQTALKLYEKGDKRAGELFVQSAKRLENASEHLREAVHNLKPSRASGVDTLVELCDDFTFCPIRFSASGDLGGSVYWELLAANLKEALTNVARHSDATMVTVDITGNADYIRLRVADNGTARAGRALTDRGAVPDRADVEQQKHPPATPHAPNRINFFPGLGLTGMRERVRSVGGTLTVNEENGFSVVCVLPKQESEEADL